MSWEWVVRSTHISGVNKVTLVLLHTGRPAVELVGVPGADAIGVLEGGEGEGELLDRKPGFPSRWPPVRVRTKGHHLSSL
jgi:hypothetical protein